MASVRKILEKLGKRYRTLPGEKRFSGKLWRDVFCDYTGFAGRDHETCRVFGSSGRGDRSVLSGREIPDRFRFSASGQKFLQAAEKKLQKLSRIDQGKEEQRYIALLLAWNAELLDEPERAALYYENLLLYDEGFRDGYGEYGMFLIRREQKGASEKLWKDYQEKEKKNLLEEGKRQKSSVVGGDQ